MLELKALEVNLIAKLQEIREKENKTLNDKEEYKKTQEKLRQLHNVMIWIREGKLK